MAKEPERPKFVELRVILNGTNENTWHQYGLKQNPFPQIARAEFDRAMWQLNSLNGEPLTGPDDIRKRLKGWSEEFIQGCVERFEPGKQVNFVVQVPSEFVYGSNS